VAENGSFFAGERAISCHGTTADGCPLAGLPMPATNTLLFEYEINVGEVYLFSPRLLNQLHFLVWHYGNQTFSLNEDLQLIRRQLTTTQAASCIFPRAARCPALAFCLKGTGFSGGVGEYHAPFS
jgi:hypothetical protein